MQPMSFTISTTNNEPEITIDVGEKNLWATDNQHQNHADYDECELDIGERKG
jgi:hypothetical protein